MDDGMDLLILVGAVALMCLLGALVLALLLESLLQGGGFDDLPVLWGLGYLVRHCDTGLALS